MPPKLRGYLHYRPPSADYQVLPSTSSGASGSNSKLVSIYMCMMMMIDAVMDGDMCMYSMDVMPADGCLYMEEDAG